MTAALLLAAAAVLSWPARRPAAGRVAPAGPRREGWPRELSPLLVGGLVSAVAAVLSTVLVALLAGGCAALGSRALRARRRAAAREERLLALAEAVGVLVAELGSGRSASAAAAAAAAVCPDGVTARVLIAAVTRGAQPPSGTAALPTVPERLRAAVALSARTGCSLTEVLGAVEEDLRARHRLALELRAATAGPRASAAVLAGLPLLGLAMGSGIGARPWSVLTTTVAGQVLLVAGVLLEVLGVAWAGRLVSGAVGRDATGRGG